jgi:nucleoside-diphosphate-sugar epimerase
MRILVTGATGRVGSRLVPRLLHQGESVCILARDPARAAPLARAGAEVLAGDLMDAEDRARALQNVESVIHLAATFRTQDTAAIEAVNEHGTVALGQAAMQAGVARFVYVSTGLVYGPGRGRPAQEDDAPRPDPGAAYPVSKVAAERSLFQLHSQAGLPLVVLRLAFVYGEGDPHLAESMMWARQWPAHKRLHMVHHEDVAQALRLALTPAAPTGRIFNVGDDAPVTTWELHRLNDEPMSAELAAMPLPDPWEGIMDTERIRTELGFRPIYRTVHAATDADAL